MGARCAGNAALRVAVAFWWLWLCLIATPARAQSTSATTQQYLRMKWAETDIVRVTFAEPYLRDAMKTYLKASDVRVVDIREPSFPMDLEAATQSTFHLLFMIMNAPATLTAANGTDAAFQPDALTAFLQSSLPLLPTVTNTNSNAIANSSGDGNGASVNQTTTGLGSFFPASNVRFEIVSTANAQALGPFPALASVDPPSSPAESFMLLHVFFHNMLSPVNLTQGMIYQTRQGVSRFLTLPSIADIYAAGPPEVPANTVLQVAQSYYLVLRGQFQNLTREARETLANLLLYGDPAREIDDFENNDGFFATKRASMFLDYIMPAQAQASTSSSSSADTTNLEVSMMEALFSFAFSSITINQFPPGNPPAPAPATPSTVIPGVSTEVVASKMRKLQRFLYDATTFASNSAAQFPASVTYPSSTSVIQANATSSCTMTSGFCTYVYWKNSVSSTFWLESMESVNRVAWNLFPSTAFFAIPDPSPMTLAPIVSPGNTSTPIWTFGALSGPSNRLDFALNLRNVDDNSTSLKVEISTDVRSSVEATSTITSIARDTSTSSSSSPTPVYQTKSNIVVTYQSRFRNSNEMFLFLEIKNSTVQTKDTSQPCAHCQNLYEWCTSQTKCAALASCVFLQGIDRDQIPYQMLQISPLQDVRELWPYFQNCMNLDSVDLKAIMLLSNAIRCQMQRLCPFRTSSYYGGGSDSDNKILIWESVEGRHQLATSPTNSHFSRDTAVNVSIKLGDQVLCYLPVFSNVTADYLEEKITRLCKLAKYLGRVSISVNMTGNNASTAVAGSYDTIDIRYKYVVGPLPKLEVVQPINSSSATTTVVQIATVAFPGIRLRLETKDFQMILPPAPSTTTPDPCVACNNLALTVCLRDLKCVAFTDCIMRYPMNNSSEPPLGDVILEAFQSEAVGEQISLSSAIDACHSSLNVNQPEWRKLVNASACFSNYSCPISMQMLVPSSGNLVGKWRINPEQKIQKLVYQQQQGASSPDLQIPLELVRDSEIVTTDSSSVKGPQELELKLQRLLEYDDISVEVEFDRIDSTSGLRTIQWSIGYSHWVGSLPRFIPTASSPMWTLFTYPSPQQDFYLEVLNKTASASNE